MSISEEWRRFSDRVHERDLLRALSDSIGRALLQVRLFYYMGESLPTAVPEALVALPDGFEFGEFGRDEILDLDRLPERRGYIYEGYGMENLARGDICLGVKLHGDVVAFMWYSLVRSHSPYYPVAMRENEAYLYDVYVVEAYRRNSVATALRYRCYEVLARAGRDRFYTIADRSNLASVRFKKKIGARVLFLGMYVRLLHRYQFRWVVKRYEVR